MKKEKNFIGHAKGLAKMVAGQAQDIDKINSDIYGISSYDNLDDVKDTVANLVNSYNSQIGGNLILKLKEREKEFNSTEMASFDKMKQLIQNSRNAGSIQTLLSGMDSTISKYEDLMIITKIMPQLKDAKKQMVNSVLSPDDFTKQIALSFTLNGVALESIKEKEVIYKNFTSILEKKKVTKHIKHTIDRTLNLGRYYMAVIPYEDLYQELLANKKKFNKVYQENTQLSDAEIIKKTEEVKFLDENALTETFDNIKNVKKRLVEVTEDAQILESPLYLFDVDILQETEFSDKNIQKLINKSNKQAKSNNDGFMNASGRQEKVESIGLTGSKIKRLDPRRLIKLAVDDTILGYYYLETQESANIIRNPGAFKFKQNANALNSDNSIDMVYKSLGDLLMKKLDKKMIQRNSDIKEQMYDVLKYADAANSRIKITYLEPEYVQEFEIDDGESMFEQSLYYAKLYMSELLSTISARVARGSDVRAYYINTDAQGGVAPMVMNAINTLKKNSRGFYSMTNLGKMISSFNQFDDLFIPRTEGDNKPIDFDIIQGQQIDINTDLLDLLEKVCVESCGVPLALLQSSSDVDFAKTYAMLNLKFMKNVLDYQIDLNPSISDFIKKILRAEFIGDEDAIKTIDSMDIRLQSPINLLLSNQLEQINNAKDLSQGIAELVMGTNDPDPDVMDKYILQIAKVYAPNVRFTEFEELLKTITVKQASEPNQEEGADGGDGSY